MEENIEGNRDQKSWRPASCCMSRFAGLMDKADAGCYAFIIPSIRPLLCAWPSKCLLPLLWWVAILGRTYKLIEVSPFKNWVQVGKTKD